MKLGLGWRNHRVQTSSIRAGALVVLLNPCRRRGGLWWIMEARAAGEGNRGREKIEERERRNAGKGEEGKGVGLLESAKPPLGVPVSEKWRNRHW